MNEPNTLWCARHWLPCPRDGKPGLLTTVILSTEALQMMPADVGTDATAINSWMENRLLPLCCELGDDKMDWLWAEVDKPHCGRRPPPGHPMEHGRVCWHRPGHDGDCEWDHPGSVFNLRDDEHFHGCPTPTGRPFDCDYCQERSKSMGGEG